MLDEIPSVKKIIQYTGEPSHPGVMSWKELMELGSSEKGEDADADLNERLSNMYVNQCCCLIYTSGTTGNPKGVMLSHDNIVFTATTTIDMLKLSKERIISYLPMSHIAGLMIDVFASIGTGSCTYFADKSALKGTLLQYLQDVKPTLFFGVPRVWEKIQEGKLWYHIERVRLIQDIRTFITASSNCRHDCQGSRNQGAEEESISGLQASWTRPSHEEKRWLHVHSGAESYIQEGARGPRVGPVQAFLLRSGSNLQRDLGVLPQVRQRDHKCIRAVCPIDN